MKKLNDRKISFLDIRIFLLLCTYQFFRYKSWRKRLSLFNLLTSTGAWAFLWKAVSSYVPTNPVFLQAIVVQLHLFCFLISLSFTRHLHLKPKWDSQISFYFSVLFICCVYTAHWTMFALAILLLKVRSKGYSITIFFFLTKEYLFWKKTSLLMPASFLFLTSFLDLWIPRHFPVLALSFNNC